jgi:hypothetical protein
MDNMFVDDFIVGHRQLTGSKASEGGVTGTRTFDLVGGMMILAVCLPADKGCILCY